MKQENTMSFEKPFFHFNPNDNKASRFAMNLMEGFDNFSEDECDVIVNIGGDGTILRSFHRLPNKPNFAVRSPESTSALFNGHHRIENAADLKRAFNEARLYMLSPLQADIKLSNGIVKTVYAYQDIVARSFNAQAVLSQESLDGSPARRVMGGGWIVATPMGSTALNETQGGHKIELGSSKMVITINGISDKQERERLTASSHVSRIVSDQSIFSLKLSSSDNKRLTSIDFDSFTILPDGELLEGDALIMDVSKKHIEQLTVHMDHSQSRQLLINQKFRTPRLY